MGAAQGAAEVEQLESAAWGCSAEREKVQLCRPLELGQPVPRASSKRKEIQLSAQVLDGPDKILIQINGLNYVPIVEKVGITINWDL